MAAGVAYISMRLCGSLKLFVVCNYEQKNPDRINAAFLAFENFASRDVGYAQNLGAKVCELLGQVVAILVARSSNLIIV